MPNNPEKYLGETGLNQLISKIKYIADLKVDKVDGKGLSTNDFTTAYKNKLDGIAAGAQVNVLEGVQLNGTNLSISSKKVNVQIKQDGTALTVSSGAVNINVKGTKVDNATAADTATAATYVGVANGSVGAGTRFSASDIKAIKDKADGLTTSYAVNYSGTGDASHTVINSQFDSTGEEITVTYSGSDKKYIKTSSGIYVDVAELKVGDAVYLTNADKPDRWVSSNSASGSPASITFSTLEAKLTGYVAGDSLTADAIVLGNGGSTVRSSGKEIQSYSASVALADDDNKIPTSKTVKSYVDGKVPDITITHTDGTIDVSSSTSGSNKTFDIGLASGYGDTEFPFVANQTAHYVLAAPESAAGAPSFRQLKVSDIQNLNTTFLKIAGGGTIVSSGSDTTRNSVTDTGMQLFSGSSGAPYTKYGIGSITRQGSSGSAYSINLPSAAGTLALVSQIPTAMTTGDVDDAWDAVFGS